MANPVYPADLPQFVQIDGYDETLPFPVVRTKTDSGPAKQRREFTAAETPFGLATDIMTATQAATFESWYIETLKHGSLEWDWVHPRTRDVSTFRFTTGPKPVPAKGGRVFYKIAIEKMP